MSLLDALTGKAIESVLDEEKQSKWASEGFDEALAAARKALPPESDEDLAEVRSLGLEALDKVAEHKDVLVELGKHGLQASLIQLASGRLEDSAKTAALIYLREQASWDEVSASILAAAEVGNEKKRRYEKAKSDVLEALADIGIALAKAALPLILSVI